MRQGPNTAIVQRPIGRLLVVLVGAGLALACQRDAEKESDSSLYDVPLRSPSELAAHLAFACNVSVLTGRPVLADVGAAWCQDCRRLAKMKNESDLARQLAHYQVVRINIGEDRHEALRERFRIQSIARWLVFQPTDCSLGVLQWTPIGSLVVEPTRKAGGATSDQLAAWLRGLRLSSSDEN